MNRPKCGGHDDPAANVLGNVPEEWSAVRLRFLLRDGYEGLKIGPFGSQLTSEMLVDAGPYKVYGQENVIANNFTRGDRYISQEKFNELSVYQVTPGDLLITMMGTSGRCGVVPADAVPGIMDSHLLRMRLGNAALAEFVRLLIDEAPYVAQQVQIAGKGSIMHGLNSSIVKNLSLQIPPMQVQGQVLLFLDRETAKIDALVEEQKRLIELLKEKRQAVISQAVTKGLDQSVPMKDSGVECLGEVPAHWQVRPLKKCIAFQEGPGIMAADFQDDGVPLLRISCVQSEAVTLAGCNYLDPDKVARQWSHFRVEIGDLLISGSASMGVVSEVGEEAEGAVPYTGLMRLQSRHGGMLKDFIKHLVVSDSFMRQVQLLKTGSTIQHFGPTHLNHMLVVLPPEDEQEAIATFLTSENRRMDSLRAEAEAGMALLEERRSALISAAVTGKIDVRGLAPQPEVTAA